MDQAWGHGTIKYNKVRSGEGRDEGKGGDREGKEGRARSDTKAPER